MPYNPKEGIDLTPSQKQVQPSFLKVDVVKSLTDASVVTTGPVRKDRRGCLMARRELLIRM